MDTAKFFSMVDPIVFPEPEGGTVQVCPGITYPRPIPPELAQISTMSHENPLLQRWEEVESDSSGDLATGDDWIIAPSRSLSACTQAQQIPRHITSTKVCGVVSTLCVDSYTYLSAIKALYDQPTDNIMLNGKGAIPHLDHKMEAPVNWTAIEPRLFSLQPRPFSLLVQTLAKPDVDLHGTLHGAPGLQLDPSDPQCTKEKDGPWRGHCRGGSGHGTLRHDLTSLATCPNRTWIPCYQASQRSNSRLPSSLGRRRSTANMLSCFSTSRGRSLRTPGRESLCERLRRRLTPSRHRRPRCGSDSAVTNTLGKVSPGRATTDEEKPTYPCEVSSSPNTNGTTKRMIPEQVSPCQETPSSSGQLSPEPGTKILESRGSPGREKELTATGPRETLRNLVYVHPDPVTTGNHFGGSSAELRPAWSVHAVRPHSLPEPFVPVFLGSEPYYGPFLPSTSTTHTSTRQALMMGRDITAPRLGTSISFVDLCDEVQHMWCLDNKQLFATKRVEEEEDPSTVSPQWELEEDVRLSELKKEDELLIHASPCAPEHPNVPCLEDQSIHRRAAGLWRKFSCANGHTFQAKRFSRRSHCAVCTDRVGGLGRQVYKCIDCKLMVHKKCHTLVTSGCGQHSLPPEPMMPTIEPPTAPDPAQTVNPSNPSRQDGVEQVAEGKEALNTRESSKASSSLGLEDFNLLRVIGRGSYAKVILVQLQKTDRMYAMKVVKKNRVNIHRVQTEKRVLEQVSSHPFLVGLHSCFQTESRLIFVLDYVNGGDLMFHMQQQRILAEPHARFYSAEISLAFNYLHQRGILYRNLKLDNLLLDSEGHIQLTDYCVCKEGLGPGDVTGTFCGTANYLAPEIIRGEEYGFSVDWWTLGVLMFEMMVGRSPFYVAENSDSPDEKSVAYLLQLIVESKIHIPCCLSVEAASVLQSFLNKDPKERLGSHPETGFVDIQGHAFFQNVDWDMLEQKRVVPPFKPTISGEFGVDNFDPQFTNEPVQITPDDKDVVRKIDGCEFAGFEYINPLSMYEEEWV
ncbi:protein kinase C iota type-like [Erethizon dorsatum]